ncbi:hypothetical protein B0T24DRAFT_299030 [Lasiosphaeria ovina]|uniref:RES domain-containing protein n=1 Tax=Lasiosphaeria ovina TaxID=92902 RepID=A0AAE0N581_9PEZI|nr:hypothetical protein B0T24DRAFT_299030 [Lasiosphaeria ovina]
MRDLRYQNKFKWYLLANLNMSESGTILAPLDFEDLKAKGLVSPESTAGFRRIHKRRLNRSSDEEHRNISFDVSLESSVAFSTIPDVLISRETMIHIGLSTEKTDELWQQWVNWPHDGPRREVDPDDGGLQVSFLDFVLGRVLHRSDAIGENDVEWRVCLDACGLAPATRDAIMDRHFTYLRQSNSCQYWVRDTIDMRYAGLQEIQRSSRGREMELRRRASRPGGHPRDDGTSQGDIETSSGLSSTPTGQQRRSASGLQQQSMPGMASDIWGSASAIASRNAPGYTTLFKGMDQGRISGLFDDAGALSNIGTLRSRAPSDFSATRSLFYFSPDVRVAEYYASYAKRRSSSESVVIVCLRIPNASIETLSEPDIRRLYWPDDAWKELVWRCRAGRSLPTRLRTYRDAILIIGTISRKPDAQYHALSSWEDITESYLLKMGVDGSGDTAVQYVFNGEDEGCEWLEENGARDIKVFPYPLRDFESWIAANPVSHS